MDTYFSVIKKRSGITLKQMILYSRPTVYSKPLANIETGRLIIISKCKYSWCKIKSDKYSGWIKKNNIWGRL